MMKTVNDSARPSISVVIPVYNSEGILRQLVQELGRVLPSVADRFEAILVNDGSQDHSWEVLGQLANEYAWMKGFNLMRNYGQHNALLCGIRAAAYDIVVTMDDDLQHPPEEIPKLLARLNEGYDVVYGTPSQQQHGLFRDLASEMTKVALQGAMGAQSARNVSSFRAFRTKLREAFDCYQGSYVAIDVLLTWGSTRFASVVVSHHPRRIGTSGYGLGKLATHTMNMVTGFSTLPLRLATIIGLAFTIVGFGILLYVLVNYIVSGGSVPGFTFVAAMIAVFAGVQLFALGIIGEYVARIHLRIMDRPTYVVSRVEGGHLHGGEERLSPPESGMVVSGLGDASE